MRDEVLAQIIRLKLGKVERRLGEVHRVALDYDETLVAQGAARCTEVESGARNVDNILTNTLLPEVSRLLLTAMAEGSAYERIRVGVDDGGQFTYALETAAS